MNRENVRNTMRNATLTALLALLLAPTSAEAQQPDDPQPDTDQPASLSPDQALQAAMDQNPALRTAVLDMQRADLALRSELYRYVPTFTVDGQAQYGRRPNLGPQGVVSVQNQSYRLAPGFEHTFPAGTTLSGEVAVDRTVQDSVFLGDLGATWGTDVRVQVVQPWLRGFGRDVGLAGRRSARAQSAAAVAGRNAEASRLARDVLTAYWELWSAQRRVAIQQQALEVTEQALDDARVRLEAGAISEADLVPLRTEAASIREQLASARGTLTSRRVELARLLGMKRQPKALRAGESPRPADDVPGVDVALEAARAQSYALRQQQKQVDSARAEAAVARDKTLARLDTTASVAVAGLGRELPPAFESLAVADGIVGTLSLRLQVPFVNKARRAEAARAELAVERARTQYEQTEDRVTAGVVDQVENLEVAQKRLQLARRTARLAEQNVAYQRTRFDNGAATALDVAQTVQDQREAELRVANLRVEVLTRRLALQDLTGSLLKHLALDEVE